MKRYMLGIVLSLIVIIAAGCAVPMQQGSNGPQKRGLMGTMSGGQQSPSDQRPPDAGPAPDQQNSK
jgi:hypothetical protein